MGRLQNFCFSFSIFYAIAVVGITSAETEKELLNKFLSEMDLVHQGISTIKETNRKVVVLFETRRIKNWLKLKELTHFGRKTIAVALYNAASSKEFISHSELLASMGHLSLYLDLPHYKNMDLKDIESVVLNAKMASEDILPVGIKKFIFSKLIAKLPLEKWTSSFVALLTPLSDGFLNHEGLVKLPKKQIGYLMYHSRELNLDCQKRYELIERYLKLHHADYFKTILKSMGKSLCFMSYLQLESVPSDSLSTSNDVMELCRVNWSELQAMSIQHLVKNVNPFQDLPNLSCRDKKIFQNCWRGVSTEVFKKVDITKQNYECFMDIALPLRLLQIIDSKTEQTISNALGTGTLPNYTDDIRLSDYHLLSMRSIRTITKYGWSVLAYLRTIFKVLANSRQNCQSMSVVNPAKLRYFERVNDCMFSRCPGYYELKRGYSNQYKGQQADWSVTLEYFACLNEKYGGVNGNKTSWITLVSRMGPFICGFTLQEILHLSEIQFRQILSEAKFSAEHCAAMKDGIQRRFLNYFVSTKKEELSSIDVLALGHSLPSLKYDLLIKMENDIDARKIAIVYLQGVCTSGQYPEWRKGVVANIALALMKVRSGKDLTSYHFHIFGCLIQYMKLSIWREIPSTVIEASIGFLAQFNVSREIRTIIFKLFKERYKSQNEGYTVTSLSLGDLKNFLLLIGPELEVKDINDLGEDILINSRDVLPHMGMNAKASRQALLITQSTFKDKGRNQDSQLIDLGKKTAVQLLGMDSLILYLLSEEIKTINVGVFKEILPFVGSMEGFSKEQLKAWASVARQAFPDFSSLGLLEVRQMQNIISGVTNEERRKLFRDKAVGYETFARAFRKKPTEDFVVARIKSEWIAFLYPRSSIALSNIPKTLSEDMSISIRISVGPTGQSDELSKEEVKIFMQNLKQLNGPILNWTKYQFGNAGAAISGLNLPEIQTIGPEYFAVIKPVAIKLLPIDIFKELSVAQITAMNAAQFAAVTPDQIGALSGDRLRAFKAKSAYGEFPDISPLFRKEEKTADGNTAGQKKDNGATNLRAALTGWITFLLVICCVTLI